MIGEGDDDVFFGPEFAVPATWWPNGQAEGLSLPGIFTAAHVVTGNGVASTAPVHTIPASTTPRPPERGERIEIRGTLYRVADTQPDEGGLIRLVLEKD